MRQRIASWYEKEWATATRWRFWPNLLIAVIYGGCVLIFAGSWPGLELVTFLVMPWILYAVIQVAVHVNAAQRYGHPWQRFEDEV